MTIGHETARRTAEPVFADRDVTEAFARAFEPLPTKAAIRCRPEDFRVEEALGFTLTGEGEHLWLWVQKRGLTTHELARRLARCAGVPLRKVGFSGLKDRRALTTQWFSVAVPPSRTPDWAAVDSGGVRVLRTTRHHRKIRRGTHRANRFRIVIRDIDGPIDALRARVRQIRHRGVPNYFGPQRFGHRGNNLSAAARLFAGHRVRDRVARGLYLSAARAWLFNLVLSERVANGTWDRLQNGDVAILEGTNSIFPVAAVDDSLRGRAARCDLHPSGPLGGRGGSIAGAEVAALEKKILAPFRAWCDGLAASGLRQERRALRLGTPDLVATPIAADALTLAFTLRRGQFATAVLRECGRLEA